MMNLFRLSMRYLRLQKKRTVATILGVVMSVALVTGTALMVNSYQDMAMKQEQQYSGTWHYKLTGKITPEQIEQLNANYLIDKAGIGSYDRYLDMGMVDSEEEEKQITGKLYLRELSENFLREMPYRIVEGRMPQNRNEIALHITSRNIGGKELKIGDTVSNPIYSYETTEEREWGTTEFASDPVLMNDDNRSFTIVGYYDSNIYFEEQRGEALTIAPEGNHTYFAYVNVKPVPDYMKSLKHAMEDCGLSEADIRANSYLRYLGQGQSTMLNALRGTLIILALIIMTVMVIVISNSFSMSMTEKISQIGTLRCIGATPSQIRSMTMYEALMIWVIALPIGLLAGTGAMAVVFKIVSDLGAAMSFEMHIIPSLLPYILPAVLSFLAVMVSAYFPARKANRISMVEAVRGTSDYQNARIKRTRKGKFWGKIFGFPGFLAAKNIRRNPRRFRVTVLSVIVSVAMFVSVGGFAGAVASAVRGTDILFQKDFQFYRYTDERIDKDAAIKAQFEKAEKEVSRVKGVARWQYYREAYVELNVPKEYINEQYRKLAQEEDNAFAGYQEMENGETFLNTWIVPISRENYAGLNFSGAAPSYDDLLSGGQVIFCRGVMSVTDGGRILSADVANYNVGDKLNAKFYKYVPSADGSDEGTQISKVKELTIGGILKEVPWYVAGEHTSGYIIVPEECYEDIATINGWRQLSDANYYLAVQAQEGKEEEISKTMSEISSQYPELYYFNIYQNNKDAENTFIIMGIFIYGFMAVIILICCVSVFNTINTNLLLRRRETAMICAVGMDKGQLIRMLLIECALYGVIGTFWGALIGLPLLFVLSNNFDIIIMTGATLVPMLYVLAALVASVVISILAGIGPIRKIIKAPIVEQIRAQE